MNDLRQAAITAGGQQGEAAAVTAAVKHFNQKLQLCHDRLERYKQRGLLFRTAYQAAEKVLKVLADVERAHTVLLVVGEEVKDATAPAAPTHAATVAAASPRMQRQVGPWLDRKCGP